MHRFKTPDYGLKVIPVDFDRQVIPGSFEHALCHLVDYEIDLSGLALRYRNHGGRGEPAVSRARYRDPRRRGRTFGGEPESI